MIHTFFNLNPLNKKDQFPCFNYAIFIEIYVWEQDLLAYMNKFYNFLALLFQMASKLPRPQLRGLFGDYIRKRMAAIISVSLVSTLPVYYYGVNQIKHKHLDFFRQVLDIFLYSCHLWYEYSWKRPLL